MPTPPSTSLPKASNSMDATHSVSPTTGYRIAPNICQDRTLLFVLYTLDQKHGITLTFGPNVSPLNYNGSTADQHHRSQVELCLAGPVCIPQCLWLLQFTFLLQQLRFQNCTMDSSQVSLAQQSEWSYGPCSVLQ